MSNSFPDSPAHLLQRMVGFDTVNSQISGVPHAERELALWLETYAQNLGLGTQRLPFGDGDFNLLITLEVDVAKPWILFESHLDVVSVGGMTIDPFGGKIEDGKIWGRGACDTKGTGAAMLWALKEYQAHSEQPNNVALLFACDEEVAKAGALAFANEQFAQLGWRPEGVIVGEPTNLQPIVAHNGVLRGTITTRGVACHSSDPSNGRSAISAMVKVIDFLESRYIPNLDATHPLTGKAQGSINVIRGGTQFNIIPDSCEILYDRRLVPGENGAQEFVVIEKLLDELRETHADMEIEMELVLLDPPLIVQEDGTFIDFVQGVLRAQGLPDQELGAPYGTDASTYCELGLSCIVLGPGDIIQAHTKDEWLALDQLEKAVEVYGALMKTAL